MSAKAAMIKARSYLVLHQPFFGVLALKLIIKEDETTQTAYTDGRVLGYNPEWIMNIDPNQRVGVIVHEIYHCMFRHMTRRSHRDPRKWNIACDYALNPLVLEAGFKLPDGALVADKYKDHTADQIYSMLPKNNKEQPDNWGEVRDGATGDADKTVMDHEWKVAVNQAAQVAKNQGKLPAGVDRLLEEIAKPKIDWKSKLRNFFTSRAKNDYTWKIPNRRHIGDDVYLPSLHGEALGEVVIFVDTSGSISQEELRQFGGEINAIVEDTLPEKIHVVYVDAKVANTEEFTIDDLPLEFHPGGGGGTLFSPGFKWVEEKGIRPECAVYLTDLYCNEFPDFIPEYPVLWIGTSEVEFHPPFGELTRMRLDDA